ncbi:SH3 domain-containing protein [Virgibacillus sp. MSP4-1]|uniref:C39 family peptidase n=1 Tax=Virgibacillus sp. MSP4-1 TaxID=2700081 RepID=UPI0003A1A327|nr:C39 family peptidase [Virgibacillus sp. MSP4-1]QHS21715.1 SH3 domain-containing protein [Virgibacillus sp. MSP4-1]
MINRFFVIVFIFLFILLTGCNTGNQVDEGTLAGNQTENPLIAGQLMTKSESPVAKQTDLLRLKSQEKESGKVAGSAVKQKENKNNQQKEAAKKEQQIQQLSYNPTEHKDTKQIAVQAANIRKGPHTSYSKITTLKRYTKLDVFEKAKVEDITWYHVKFRDQNKGWISSKIVEDYNPQAKQNAREKQSDRKLLSAPLVSQMPELPRGCEVTTLSMMLAHAGVHVDKMTLAEEVRKDPTPFSRKNGQVHFGHPNNGFVGNMYTFDKPGLGVFHDPIADLGEKYLPGRIVDLTGSSFDRVLSQIDKGKPVWVLTTSWFSYVPESYWETWNTPSGKVKVTYKMHSVLITGYDDRYVYFNDPLANMKDRKVAKDRFIAGWNQFGNQAISYK